MKREIRTWELNARNHQIADTGDVDGHFELSDGMTALVTRDDICGEDAVRLTEALNNMGVNWECNTSNNLEYELYLERENTSRWKTVAEELYAFIDAPPDGLEFAEWTNKLHAVKDKFHDAISNLPHSNKTLTMKLVDLEKIADEMYRALDRPISGLQIVWAMEKYQKYKQITNIVNNANNSKQVGDVDEVAG